MASDYPPSAVRHAIIRRFWREFCVVIVGAGFWVGYTYFLVAYSAGTLGFSISAVSQKELSVLMIVAVCGFISGVFGVVGGMALIGTLLVLLDLTTAMLMITAVLTVGIGWQIWLMRAHLEWRVLKISTLGAGVAFVCICSLKLVPDKALVFVLLGAPPLIFCIAPCRWWPSVDSRLGAFCCGFVSASVQILGGASAALIDLFFRRSSLSRLPNVATKTGLIFPSQIFRAMFFGYVAYGDFGKLEGSLPLWVYPAAIVVGLLSTSVGTYVLRLYFTDRGFLGWSWFMSVALSVAFVVYGALLMLWGR
jgi:hypothetical protein